MKRTPISPNLIPLIQKRYNAGESYKAIAADIGVSWNAVCAVIKKGVDAATVQTMINASLSNFTGIAAARIVTVEVKLPDGSINQLSEQPHTQFSDLLGLIEEGHKNLMMVGPAGSGKTIIAKNLAQALGRDFGFISLSAGVTETHLFGRTLPQADGAWKFIPARFVEMYTRPGVFLLDEFDAADSNLMVSINAAMANGMLVTPDGVIHHRHADFIIVAAANTWGRGADQMYVGRNQLDASTLDRFVLATVILSYDVDLERRIAESELPTDLAGIVTAWVWGLREAIIRNRLRRVASTRLLISAVKALRQGRSLSAVKARYFQDWSTDEQGKVGR